MTNNCLVSVIIPVYNVGPYIREALDSVTNQSYANLEIILVDDGSTDGSGEICDRYAGQDHRIRVFHQGNSGLSAARNAGLDVSSGELIAFLDPDDAFHPGMIQMMLDVMKQTAADIVICDYQTIRTQGSHLSTNQKSNSPVKILSRNEALRKVLDNSINTAVWNKLYKREIWENLRFPVGHVYEGTYVVFDIFDKADRIAILNRKLIKHRIRPGSICQTISVKNMQDSYFSGTHYIEYIESHTPQIFTLHELQKVQSTMVTATMSGYAKYIIRRSRDKEGREGIRKLLEESGESLKYCGMVVQTIYKIMLLNPYVGVLLYLPYCGFFKVKRWIANMNGYNTHETSDNS